MYLKKPILVLLVIILTGCSPATTVALPPTPTSSPVPPTATDIPTLTPTATETPEPTSTSTPEPTPTATPIPEEIKQAVLDAYKIMLFIQVDASMLDDVATKVKAGDLVGFESFGALIVLAALVNAVEEAIPQTTPPELIKPYWDQVLPIHAATKALIAQWYNKEIDSTIVLEEVAPILDQVEQIMSDLDHELATTYGFDAKELNQFREETIQSMNEIFGTPTPSPSP